MQGRLLLAWRGTVTLHRLPLAIHDNTQQGSNYRGVCLHARCVPYGLGCNCVCVHVRVL